MSIPRSNCTPPKPCWQACDEWYHICKHHICKQIIKIINISYIKPSSNFFRTGITLALFTPNATKAWSWKCCNHIGAPVAWNLRSANRSFKGFFEPKTTELWEDCVAFNKGHYMTPTQMMRYCRGNGTLRITLHLHCLIPPGWVI